MPDWKPYEPSHPFEGPLSLFASSGPHFTTAECVRILAANGFRDPVFEQAEHEHIGVTRRCTVVGPDGERHLAGKVLEVILRAERLEQLCQDRSDAVMGLLRRDPSARR